MPYVHGSIHKPMKSKGLRFQRSATIISKVYVYGDQRCKDMGADPCSEPFPRRKLASKEKICGMVNE